MNNVRIKSGILKQTVSTGNNLKPHKLKPSKLPNSIERWAYKDCFDDETESISVMNLISNSEVFNSEDAAEYIQTNISTTISNDENENENKKSEAVKPTRSAIKTAKFNTNRY